MTTILGISGSLRRGLVQRGAAARGRRLDARPARRSRSRTIKGIPLYDGDVEAASGVPGAVAQLKEQIVARRRRCCS